MTQNLSVLIVGAGPTGLAMATELHRHGVQCRIIDKALEPTKTSNAIALHARSLEILDDIGLSATAIEQGLKVKAMNLNSDKKQLAHLEFSALKSPYQFILSLPQKHTEEIFTQHLATQNITVERGVELIEFTSAETGVTAKLRTQNNQEETITVDWLIGCDGSHSTVRKTQHIDFGGREFSQQFIMADVAIECSLAHDEGHGFLTHQGAIVFLPLPQNNYRLIAEVSQDAELKEVETPTLQHFERLIKERTGMEMKLAEPTWTSKFHIHARMVDKYRAGRVFLAGDAAHIHSPVGAQGMNTGLQDAYNLAWKLALVIKGVAEPSLLDSYQVERLPVARAVLKESTLMTQVISFNNSVVKQLRDTVLPFITGIKNVKNYLAEGMAQLTIHYRKSHLSVEQLANKNAFEKMKNQIGWQAGPRAGDRMTSTDFSVGFDSSAHLIQLLRGTEHHLLVFSGKTSQEADYSNLQKIHALLNEKYANFIKAHLITDDEKLAERIEWKADVIKDKTLSLHKLYGANTAALYLIRPDKYIGFKSEMLDVDALQKYLGKLFTL